MTDVQGVCPVKQISMQTADIKIRVFVSMLWTQSYRDNPSQLASMEMILLDSEGNKVQASVLKFLIPEFRDVICEGGFYEISQFGVRPNKGNYLLVDHDFKINFLRLTKVRVCSPFSINKDHYNIVSFANLLEWSVSQIYAFDVVGKLVSISDLRVIKEAGKETKSVEFSLEDTDLQRIDCALWGDLASKLVDYCTKERKQDQHIIVLIHNAKIKEWRGKPQVSNQLFGCRLHINDDVHPISNFIEKMKKKENEGDFELTNVEELTPTIIVNDASAYYKSAPVTTVEMVRSASKVFECVVRATIIAVLLDEGWFTYACKACEKKVQMIKVEGDSKRQFDCLQCGSVSDVYGRVRTVVRVQDVTGSTSLILFDRQLSRLLNRSISWINQKIKKIDDPRMLPDEFQKLVNMELVFKISVSEINLKYQYPAYTVLRATDDQDVIEYVNSRLNHPITEHEQADFVQLTPDAKVSSMKVMDDQSPSLMNLITPVPFSLKRKSESPPEEIDEAGKTTKSVDAIASLKIGRMEEL